MKERYLSGSIIVLCFLGIIIQCYGLPAKYFPNNLVDSYRRIPRYATCPSCRQDCPAALASPWYGEPNYGATSCTSCHYNAQAEAEKQWGQDYHFSNPYIRLYQYPRYNRAARSSIPKSTDLQYNGNSAQYTPQQPPHHSLILQNPEPYEGYAQSGITKEEYDSMIKSNVPYEEEQYPTGYYEADGAEEQYADNNGQSFYPKQQNYPQGDVNNWQERIPQKYSEAEAFEPSYSPKVSSHDDGRRIEGQEAASRIGQAVIESESDAAYQQQRQQQQSQRRQQENQYQRRYRDRPRRIQQFRGSQRQVQRFEQQQQRQQENRESLRLQDNGREEDLEYLQQRQQQHQENEQQQQLQQLKQRHNQYQENPGQVQVEESQRFAQEQYNKRYREQSQAQQQQLLQRRQGRDSYDAFDIDDVTESKQNSQRRFTVADALAKIRTLRQRDTPIYDQKNHWTIREIFDSDAPEETTADVGEDESLLEIIAREDVDGINVDGNLNIGELITSEHGAGSLKEDFFQDDRTIVDDGEFNNEKSIFQRDLSGTYGNEAREEKRFDPDLIDDVEHPPLQATEIPIKRSTLEETSPSA